jgi:hypothetical protein
VGAKKINNFFLQHNNTDIKKLFDVELETLFFHVDDFHQVLGNTVITVLSKGDVDWGIRIYGALNMNCL